MKKAENCWLKWYFSTMLKGNFKEESYQQKHKNVKSVALDCKKFTDVQYERLNRYISRSKTNLFI